MHHAHSSWHIALLAVAAVTLLGTGPSHGQRTLDGAAFIELGSLDYLPGPDPEASNTGSWSPRVELPVLPARAGHAPQLGLVYNQSRNNGLLGAGWSLSFLSRIERRSATKGIPGLPADDDVYLVDGRPLLRDLGPYYTADDPDTAYTRSTHGWTATRDGTTLRFGLPQFGGVCPAAASVVHLTEGCAAPVQWLLTSIEDAHGNLIRFFYEEVDGASRPTAIRYNIDGPSDRHQVTFEYEARPDVRLDYGVGRMQRLGERLAVIRVATVRAGVVTPTHTYRLDYGESVHGVQSLLTAVVQEGAERERLLRRFEYADSAPGFDLPVDADLGDEALMPAGWREQLNDLDAPDTIDAFSLLADVNGDARPDLLVFNSSAAVVSLQGEDELQTIQNQRSAGLPQHKVFVNTSTPGALRFELDAERTTALWQFFGSLFSSNKGRLPYDVVDLDRDGYADLVNADGRIRLGGESGWGDDLVADWAATPDVFRDYQRVDLDADGLPDLVGQTVWYRNSGEAPFFDLTGPGEALTDPLAGDGTAEFGSGRAGCMHTGSPDADIRPVLQDLGWYVESSNNELRYDRVDVAAGVSPRGWLWRHTLHTDVNGDGVIDRVIDVDWLVEAEYDAGTTGWSPISVPVWSRPEVVAGDPACGGHEAVYLGDGRGGFHPAGYGVGGPMWAYVVSRSEPAAGAASINYDVRANHLSFVDVDGSGRAEATQVCDGRLAAVVHAGATGHGTGGDPCQPTRIELAEWMPAGQQPITSAYGAIRDLDGDGFADLFVGANAYVTDDRGALADPTSFGGEMPRWQRNRRTAAQHKLIAVTTGRGQTTYAGWTSSAADPETEMPVNLRLLASLGDVPPGDPDGQTRFFEYIAPVYDRDDSAFRGFGTQLTTLPTGATRVRHFSTREFMPGTLLSDALHAADGALAQLTVDVYPDGHDVLLPWANSRLRRCSFQFDIGAVAQPAPGFFIEACHGFGGEPSALGGDLYRARITEWDYDGTIGRPIEIRHLQDPTIPDDTHVEYLTWLDGDWPLLETRTLADADGTVLSTTTYADYVGDDWQATTEDSLGETRTRTRDFDERGQLLVDRDWVAERATTYTYDACGEVTRTVEALPGHDVEVERDARCLEVERRTAAGLIRTRSYDDFRRLERETRKAAGPDGTAEIEWWAYDDHAAIDAPARIQVLPETDGSFTALRTVLNLRGETIKTERCRTVCTDPDACLRQWTVDLDDTLGCDPADARGARIVLTSYDPATRSPQAVSEPFYSNDEMVFSTVYTYDSLGRRVSETLPDGEVATYSYAPGRVTRTDPLGVEQTVHHDTLGHVVEIGGMHHSTETVDPLGRVIHRIGADQVEEVLTRGPFGRLEARILPAVQQLAACGEGTQIAAPMTRYAYWDSGEVATETDPNGYTHFSFYDLLGRPTQRIAPTGETVELVDHVDVAWPDRTRATTDADGATRIEYLDGLDRVWKAIDPDGGVTTVEFDAQGRPWRETKPWGEQVETLYDRSGFEAGLIRTMGDRVEVTSRTNDASGRPVEFIDADGSVRRMTYDAHGHRTRVTLGDEGQMLAEASIYDAVGQLVEQTVAGARTRYTRDTLGRVIVEQQGYDPVTQDARVTVERTWDAGGRLLSEADGTGQGVQYGYDAAGRRRFEAVFDADGVVGSVSFQYDAAGNRVAETDARGLTRCMDYDPRSRVLSITEPGTAPTRIEYTHEAPHPLTGDPTLRTRTTRPTGEASAIWTDWAGRTVAEQAADGRIVSHVFDAGRLVRSERRGSDGALMALKPRSYYVDSDRVRLDWDWMAPAAEADCHDLSVDPDTFVPDPACPVGAIHRSYADGGAVAALTDAAGNTHRFTWRADGTGLLATKDDGAVTERYDYADGLPVRISASVGPEGAAIARTWTYDRWLRVDRERRRGPDGSREVIAYDYDAAGRRTRALLRRDGALETELTTAWNARDQIVRKSWTIDAGAGESAHTATMAWSYGADGRLARMTYPSGHVITYTDRADASRLETIDLGPRVLARLHHDEDRVVGVELDDGALRFRRTFDLGREVERTIRDDLGTRRETYAYDPLGRLSEWQLSPSGGSFQALRYTYDSRGFVIGDAHQVGLTVTQRTYGYDAAGRRTTSTTDALGALQAADYDYDTGHRLASVDGRPVTWDAYGRQVEDHLDRRFAFGLGDQLRSITAADGSVRRMTYDADGQRVARVDEDTLAVDYFLSGASGQVLHQRKPNGAMHDMVYTPDGPLVAIVITGSTGDVDVHPVVPGMTGSPAQIGATGAPRMASAFGEPLSDPDRFEVGFHGTWATESGVRIAGVRAYDPATGRFLSRDPLGLAAAADANDSHDLFRYAHNRPTAMADPNGYLAMELSSYVGMAAEMYSGFVGSTMNSSYIDEALGRMVDTLQMDALVVPTIGSIDMLGCTGACHGGGHPFDDNTSESDAGAGDPTGSEQEADTEAETSPNGKGVRVVPRGHKLDPRTGKIVPMTAEEKIFAAGSEKAFNGKRSLDDVLEGIKDRIADDPGGVLTEVGTLVGLGHMVNIARRGGAPGTPSKGFAGADFGKAADALFGRLAEIQGNVNNERHEDGNTDAALEEFGEHLSDGLGSLMSP